MGFALLLTGLVFVWFGAELWLAPVDERDED